MPERNYTIHVGTQADLSGLKAAVEQVNASTRATHQANDAEKRDLQQAEALRKRLATAAARQRQETFNALPIEQRIATLKERQVRLQEYIVRVQKQGTEQRRLALTLAARQNALDLSALEKQQAGKGLGLLALGGGLVRQFAPAALLSLLGLKLRSEASEVSRFAEEITDLAGRLDVTAEMAQQLSYAANKAGVSNEDLAVAFKTIDRTATAAAQGNKQLLAIYERFGITSRQVKELRPPELFLQMARNAGPAGTAVAGTTDALKVMGDSADKVFAAIRTGFANSADEIRNLGGVIENDVIQKLDEAAKELAIKKLQIRAEFAPPLAELQKKFLDDFREALQDSEIAIGVRIITKIRHGMGVKEAINSTFKEANEDRAKREQDAKAAAETASRNRTEVARLEGEIAKLESTKTLGDTPSQRRDIETQQAKLRGQITEIKTGVNPFEKELEEEKKAEAELAALQEKRRFKALTDAEKLIELTGKRKKLEEDAAFARNQEKFGTGEKEAIEAVLAREKQIDELTGQIDSLKKHTSPSPRAPVDAIQRIGGTLNVSPDNLRRSLSVVARPDDRLQVELMRKQVSLLEKQLSALKIAAQKPKDVRIVG